MTVEQAVKINQSCLATQIGPQGRNTDTPDDNPCVPSYQDRETTYIALIGLWIRGWLCFQVQNEERNGVFV